MESVESDPMLAEASGKATLEAATYDDWARTGHTAVVINTATTIVTFLMVALLQNSQHRAEQAIHQKLDAVADGLADFMEHLGGDQPGFAEDIDDLRRSVGIEKEMVDKHAPRARE